MHDHDVPLQTAMRKVDSRCTAPRCHHQTLICLSTQPAGAPGLPGGACAQRGPALPALHVRLDGQSQGAYAPSSQSRSDKPASPPPLPSLTTPPLPPPAPNSLLQGLVHTTGGYLAYTQMTHRRIFDYNKGDIYACVADIGWITGHSYVVYGPLLNGATSVLFESVPTYPDAGRYWEVSMGSVVARAAVMGACAVADKCRPPSVSLSLSPHPPQMVERLKINQFYTAPTAIRLLIKSGDDFVKKYDRSSLRILGTGWGMVPLAGGVGCHPHAQHPPPPNTLCSWRTYQPRGLALVP